MPDTDQRPRPHDSLIPADENRAMFDTIAGYYDGTNRILSLGFDAYWRRRGVALLDPKSEGSYLDVGAGTGDIALEILRQRPESRVVGIDPSRNMLEIGWRKVGDAGLSGRISLEEGDVLNLRFEDASFDGAITSFCIRNVTDRRRGLQEIRRVLKSGSRLVIVELTEPRGPIMQPLFRIYARVVMPLVTRILSSVSAYRYLANSMADFPAPEVFSNLMHEAGFVNVQTTHVTGGIVTLFVAEAP